VIRIAGDSSYPQYATSVLMIVASKMT
jgi:hypothetical protein